MQCWTCNVGEREIIRTKALSKNLGIKWISCPVWERIQGCYQHGICINEVICIKKSHSLNVARFCGKRGLSSVADIHPPSHALYPPSPYNCIASNNPATLTYILLHLSVFIVSGLLYHPPFNSSPFDNQTLYSSFNFVTNLANYTPTSTHFVPCRATGVPQLGYLFFPSYILHLLVIILSFSPHTLPVLDVSNRAVLLQELLCLPISQQNSHPQTRNWPLL